MWENIYTFISISIMIIIIVFMAYFATVLISKKSNFYFQGKTVKVLERTVISTNLSITIIQAMDKVYILAICNKNAELLDIIEYEKWIEYKKNQSPAEQKDLLDVFKNSFFNKQFENIKQRTNPIKNNKDKKGD